MTMTIKSVVSIIFDITAFTIALALFLVLEFVLSTVSRLVDPVSRGFYCNDESIRYPYQDHPIVSEWALMVFTVLVPMAVVRK